MGMTGLYSVHGRLSFGRGGGLQQVGLHLQVKAVGLTDRVERDLFGRSSYNRYYYATFLCVRRVLAQMRPQWAFVAHAKLPEVLKGQIIKDLTKRRQRARKMDDDELVRQCSRAIKAASELADLLRASSATRVVADYHPEIAVDFVRGDRFTLNEVGITEAHQWPERALVWIEEVSSAWRQVDD